MVTDPLWRVVYHPIVDRGGSVTGWEALARGPHPDPIPDLGTIYPTAIEAAPPNAPLHLNLCPSTLSVDNLPLLKMLSHQRPIVWELIESGTMTGTQTDVLLELLESTPAKLALDDVGAGTEDIGRLLTLPAAVTKLDITVIRAALESPDAAERVAKLVQFARTLGHRVIAEGTETLDHIERITGLGVDETQGWGWCQPMSGPDARAWVPRIDLTRPQLEIAI